MHSIECFRLFARNANALLRNNTKPGFLDHRIDGAGQIALGHIGFMIEKVRSIAIGSSFTGTNRTILRGFIREDRPRGLYRWLFRPARSVVKAFAYTQEATC